MPGIIGIEKMGKKIGFGVMLTLLLLTIFSFVFSTQNAIGPGYSSPLNPLEQQVVSMVNGSRAYNYDLELEKIALENPWFRSGGSPGATEAAYRIKDQFTSFGLDTWLENFQFTARNILSKPSLLIDDDGNSSTTNDQVARRSFQSAHFSLGTPPKGVFGDLVVLPLPPAANRNEIGKNPINMTAWNAIDLTGKIVLIGKEVRMNAYWGNQFFSKLSQQPPLAIVYTWWYDWMSFTPVQQGSAEGRLYFCPVGLLNYEDGLWIRNRETALDVSARFSINSVSGTESHYNVVGKITGYENPEKIVIVSGHYDTVMTAGFVDNGAGTAGVLEIAKTLASAVQAGYYKPKYTILFVAFASEELGLVGAINYVRMHKSEMSNTVAVVNLDCIGSDELRVSETNSVGEFDLDQTLLEAAQDLGITAVLETPSGSSDHEVFRSPWWADEFYFDLWNLHAGISDATPVESSSLISSVPLLYSDLWNFGAPGWIHTSYDNSTSTQMLNWAEVEDLEKQIRVVALALLRISPSLRELIPPFASFTFSPSGPLVGQNVVFNASASYDSDGTILWYSWDFGDSTKVNETDPVSFHAYAASGTYNVTLTVIDYDGQRATASAIVAVTLIVHDVAVVSVAPFPTEVVVGQNVTITVVVKNEGNATEAFSIVTFYNDTEIGAKNVSSLIEGNMTSLNFTWSTSGVAEGQYTIRAVASPVLGEIDQVDNTSTASTRVKVTQPTQPPQPPAQPPQPPPTQTVQLPLGVPLGIIGVIVIIAVAIVGVSFYLYSREEEQQKP